MSANSLAKTEPVVLLSMLLKRIFPFQNFLGLSAGKAHSWVQFGRDWRGGPASNLFKGINGTGSGPIAAQGISAPRTLRVGVGTKNDNSYEEFI